MKGHELRCENRLHAIFIPPETVEIKCNDRFCGAVSGEVVVLHRFNIRTREVTTFKFQPVDRRKKVTSATHRRTAAVRSS